MLVRRLDCLDGTPLRDRTETATYLQTGSSTAQKIPVAIRKTD